MKKKKIYTILAACFMGLTLTNCDSFLDYNPTAVIDEDKAFSDPDAMVTAAYAMLGDCWYTYPFNLWPYGDLTSDDCLKGGWGTGDTNYHHLEIWTSLTATNPDHMDELWYRLYCAISRCNRAIVALQRNGASTLGEDITNQRLAEVKFLRAHFYYKLITLFRQVPWIDEVVFENNTTEEVRNNQYSYEELFGKIIDDFQTAYDVLPAKQEDGGRVNKIAAASYLAKCYLNLAWGDGYEATTGISHINRDYMQKVIDYTDAVVNSEYGYLEDFGDIFLPDYKNSKESIFAVQASDYADDHTTYGRANWSNMLNGCWGIWTCGWDCHKPSQNLVNAFKTRNGLPMFDDFNDEIAYPVNGEPTDQKWDPRLFHTVGMPSFPYKYEAEYTLDASKNARAASVYGYYSSMKEVPQRSKGEIYNGSWQAFAMNDYIFRYTDVMLMRAEALIELDRLEEARTIINAIRQRAANSVSKHIAYAADQCEIALYPASYFQDKETARKCLRWERRLEMAMEGNRYFDLRRWGIASETLNAFFASEQNDSYTYVNSETGETITQPYGQYYKDAHYTAGKNEFFPIPYNQLFYIPGLYVQNAGY